MRVHFQRDVDKLKRQLLALGAEVENDVRTAIRAIEDRNEELARQVIDRETQTNVMEVDVEDDCLKILALHQPVAADLRYIIAVLKINQDLERIGDLAAHIAERGLFLCSQPPIAIPFQLGEMADKAQSMLKKVLDAFVNLNNAAAHEVCAADSEIDAINRDIFQQVKTVVTQNPALFEALLQILHIARHLERIADHATNIAEDLIYLIEGRIVRHTQEVSDKAAKNNSTKEKGLEPGS
ncbi:MAG TPA: phosphate transport system regulatory protein PhoU [Verrucomicrobia bacterium]|nr:MAG: phosphate transport system regulatory protein PhoU [Lentisphaerae bacterium GWF2_57_35]HBA83976.1 phosphate transport system regulatory protein PhoU [Verrucomicrobiota bacterium]